jgi:tetrapyrrole methylase family protein/MazG family protein
MLRKIVAKLRSPDGCPWDRAQTHASMKANLLQECYEVLETLEEAPQKLCQELGDLLMQIVFHAQIAAESQDFDLDDVVYGINTKLIRRHPHVFGEVKVKDAQEVLINWEALKQKENEETSLLAGVPKEMPALLYSQTVQERVARVGFDWKEVEGIVEKLAEEVGELSRAVDQREREQEFGDLLFTLANIARRTGVDLETALRLANRRFHRRFSYMEEVCRQKGVSLASLSPAQQNSLWEEAKRKAS